jgi:hypothetical protein
MDDIGHEFSKVDATGQIDAEVPDTQLIKRHIGFRGLLKGLRKNKARIIASLALTE